MSSESYRGWLRSLVLCWCHICRALIHSLGEFLSVSGWKSNANTENLFKTHYGIISIIFVLYSESWNILGSRKKNITVHTQSHTMFTYIQPQKSNHIVYLSTTCYQTMQSFKIQFLQGFIWALDTDVSSTCDKRFCGAIPTWLLQELHVGDSL